MDYSINSFSSDTTLIFYFLFSTLGYQPSTNNFFNYAEQNVAYPLEVDTSSLEWGQPYWFDMNDVTSTEGTINQPMTFDGYTCINNKTRL